MSQRRYVSMGALFIGTVAAGLSLSLTTAAQSPSPAGRGVPTFSRDVAPILYARCVTCHRPGEVGPMSLIAFKDVRPWATAIKQKTSARIMPPWGADPHYGRFRNDPSLSEREISTLAAWADAGAPEGDAATLPPPPTFSDGWQIGRPDQVFEMLADFDIPARGTVDYQYFEVPTHFTEDRWMQAGEVRAGDRAHVHHIIVYVKEPAPVARPAAVSVRPILAPGVAPSLPSRLAAPDTTAASRTGGDQMLVNWAVGEDAPVFPAGMAKRIPAGSSLIFQVHYTTNGTASRDRSRIGLVFATEPPRQEIRTALVANPLFAIPAGEPNHSVEAEATFTEDVKVWTMHPHMHLRGKDMTYTATYPDGRKDIVLSVPKYDFAWQTDYWLAEPLFLPKGSKLHVAAHFDNSPANRANPDPAAVVRWGDQTWEEMMIGFFTYTVENRAPQSVTSSPPPARR